MAGQAVVALNGLELAVPEGRQAVGTRVLAGLVGMAEAAVGSLHRLRQRAPATFGCG